MLTSPTGSADFSILEMHHYKIISEEMRGEVAQPKGGVVQRAGTMLGVLGGRGGEHSSASGSVDGSHRMETLGARFAKAIKYRESVLKEQSARRKTLYESGLGGDESGEKASEAGKKSALFSARNFGAVRVQNSPLFTMTEGRAFAGRKAPPERGAVGAGSDRLSRPQHQSQLQQPESQSLSQPLSQLQQQPHPHLQHAQPPQLRPPPSQHVLQQQAQPPVQPTMYYQQQQQPPSVSDQRPNYNAHAQIGGCAAKAYGMVGRGENTMRRRPNNVPQGDGIYSSQYDQQQQDIEREQDELLQQRKSNHRRIDEAHQVEKTLSELATMFSSLSNMIMHHGEVLTKIEDDTTLASLEVESGGAEIQKLYGIKKGNRGLIVKVFLCLCFLILVFRFW